MQIGPARLQRALVAAERRPAITIAVALYLILAILGITTSSLGAGPLRQDPAHPLGTQLGEPQAIRSDEFITETPINLGDIAAAESFDSNPLAQPPGFLHQIPSGPTTSLTFFEGTLFRLAPWVPDQMFFAAKWWLPTLLLVIFAPLWFREVTGRARFGFLSVALIFFAPANTWWSYRPVSILGFIFAGSYLIFPICRLLSRRRWLGAGLLALVAGVLLARYPGQYQPFAIVLGLPVLITTAVSVLSDRIPTRVKLASLGLVGGFALLFVAGLFLENWDAIQAGLSTVYPGTRRSTGGALSVGELFGAGALGDLTTTTQIVTSNASEVSSGFTVAIVWAGVLFVGSRAGFTRPRQTAIIAMSACTAFWVAWCTVSWGQTGQKLPLANLVPPHRAGAMIGFLGAILVCLVLSHWQRPESWRIPLSAGLVVALLTAWGGSSLGATFYPGLTAKVTWAFAIIVGICVSLVTRYPDKTLPLGLTVGALVLLTFRVNPIVVGLGDLRASSTAKQMLGYGKAARDAKVFWASDSVSFDSLKLATGVPSLSGRQQIGPKPREWAKLDVGRRFENTWNRGATFVRFAWSPSAAVTFGNPSIDSVLIGISPCVLHQREPQVAVISAIQPLKLPCLKLRQTLPWAGEVHWIYDVT